MLPSCRRERHGERLSPRRTQRTRRTALVMTASLAGAPLVTTAILETAPLSDCLAARDRRAFEGCGPNDRRAFEHRGHNIGVLRVLRVFVVRIDVPSLASLAVDAARVRGSEDGTGTQAPGAIGRESRMTDRSRGVHCRVKEWPPAKVRRR